ncbi:MAG: hypothetical protein FWG90_13805 [Oscillospiraceae bacterium]|nr:hypothetical protein [Oscillospiraceae bacterium]
MKVSYKVAFGGVVSSLCLLLMFLTAVFPVLALALPIFSGMLIAMVAIEINVPWGFVTYAAVAVLSIFVTPDKQAAIFFIFFFGYYPVLKLELEKRLKKLRVIRWVLKFAAFNAAIVSSYYLIINIFGAMDFFAEFGFTGKYLIAGLLGFGNIVFILYDSTLSLMIITYIKWFRPTFLKKIK